MATRVTLSLDDDLVAELQKMADRIGCPLEKVVEEAVKDSLRATTPPPPARKSSEPFVVRAKALNPYPWVKFDDIEELLEQAEGPTHR
jgi:ribbon-helix-helix CopG family protein